MQENVFAILSRHNLSAPENYLTESLAYVLRLLLERQPALGLDVVQQLCGLPLDRCSGAEGAIAIRTQVTTDEGRPDMEIRHTDDTLVYVEVKHGAPLGQGQLEYYRRQLDASGAPRTALVLLTRSRSAALGTTLPPDQYRHVCWYEVYDWLAGCDLPDEVSAFVVANSLAFLEDQHMSQQHVTWDYIRGVPAMLHLTDMLGAALEEAIPEVALKKTGGWSWRGFRVPPDLWCGFRYDTPLRVAFENRNGYGPTYSRQLDLQTALFFALDKGCQFECLVRFIREAWESAPEVSGPLTVSEDEDGDGQQADD